MSYWETYNVDDIHLQGEFFLITNCILTRKKIFVVVNRKHNIQVPCHVQIYNKLYYIENETEKNEKEF